MDIIEQCKDCPDCLKGNRGHYCYGDDGSYLKMILDPTDIPDWCPRLGE